MTKNERLNVVLAVAALILATLSLTLGFALRAAKADRQLAIDDAAHWKRVASKAYTGYLLMTSPVGDDGIVHQIAIPRGTKLEGGMMLPPDDFCAKGMLQCDQPK